MKLLSEAISMTTSMELNRIKLTLMEVRGSFHRTWWKFLM